MRPVRGRVLDPFRGAPHDEDPERFASRTVDAQPLADVVAVFERLPGVRVVRAGRRFTLGRGHEVAKVAFASAARSVSLEDATFEGDGALLLALLHALLPLFGAVEIRIGSHRELVDGHEPLDAIAKRYESWWIDESLKLAKRMQQPPPAPAPKPPVATVHRPRNGRRAAVLILLVIAVALAGIWRATRGADVGETCIKNTDCDSEACLPEERARTIGDFAFRPPPPTDPTGVCTKPCATDADCPGTMACTQVMSFGAFGPGTRKLSCVPRAWR